MKALKKWAIVGCLAALAPLVPQMAQRVNAQPATSFQCRSSDDVNFTVALSQNGNVSDPIIVWASDAFSSSGYTPERRCQAVTQRLNDALAENDYTLRGLYLTVGRVNGQSVVCTVASTRSGCNRDNVLFTLSSNPRNPEQVLYNLSARTTGTTVQESGGLPYVDLNQLVNDHF